MRQSYVKSLIGSKAFYKMIIAIVVPIVIQNGITQFVTVLDNIMVGRLGTEQISGVAIANQLIFVFNLTIFGGLSGAGIFGAQFAGKGDEQGMRYALRFKLWICAAISAVSIIILLLFNEPLLNLFLHQGSEEGDLAAALAFGKQYLFIMLLGLLPHSIAQAYASSLREAKETFVPMMASGFAVLLNLVLNYFLIFGRLGFPELGVRGAAIATVISRFAELLIIVVWSHRHKDRFTFIKALYRSFHVPWRLTKDIILKGMPLLINEALWSLGMTMLQQRYSVRGLAVVTGLNISGTVSNLFNIVFMSIGSSIGIVVGNLLGANKLEEARDADRKIIALSLISSVFFAVLLGIASPFIPLLYNTTDEVRTLASQFLLISAFMMPFIAFTHACYFTLRSGGQVKITMLFDSCFVWGFCIPLAYVLSRFTAIPIIPMYIIVSSTEVIKCVIGYILVKSGKWIINIVK